MKSKKSGTVTPSNGTLSADRHTPYVVSPKGEWTPEKAFAMFQIIANIELWKRSIDVPRASGMDLS